MPRKPPTIPPPPPIPELSHGELLDAVTLELRMLRGETRAGLAAVEQRVMGIAKGVGATRGRGYSVPMTVDGKVVLDEVQDELDRLRRKVDEADARAEAEKELARRERERADAAKADADLRLRRWTSILSVVLGVAGLGAGFLYHFLGR